MKLLSLKNGLALSLSLLMPGALKAMDEAQPAKWKTWTRFFLERKHTSDLKSSFFGADRLYAIDAEGNSTCVDTSSGIDDAPDHNEYSVVARNPASTNQQDQADACYSAKVTVLKALLDDRKKISKLKIEYSIFKISGDNQSKTLVSPTALTIGCEHVEKITVENLEPFDLYFTTNIYGVTDIGK
jgi:hypothetical protein